MFVALVRFFYDLGEVARGGKLGSMLLNER